jgi:hypothetical protein
VLMRTMDEAYAELERSRELFEEAFENIGFL